MLGDLLGAGLGAGLGGGMGGRGGFQAGTKGADIQASIDVSFEEAVTGAKRRVKVGDRMIDVGVPAGVETGRVLRLRGQGGAGQGGLPSGDLMVTVTVKPHPLYQRDGDDIRMDLPVSLGEVLKGGRVEAAIPGGQVALKIPAGANSGTILRLKGKGVQRNAAPGDLFVRLFITLPEGDQSELSGLLDTWSLLDQAPKRGR